jgi:hypothetical protein
LLAVAVAVLLVKSAHQAEVVAELQQVQAAQHLA